MVGLALIILGLILALFVHWILGVALMIAGLVLLLVGR